MFIVYKVIFILYYREFPGVKIFIILIFFFYNIVTKLCSTDYLTLFIFFFNYGYFKTISNTSLH